MTTASLAVRVNGDDREVPAGTSVSALCEMLQLPTGRFAVEINREIVPRSTHASRTLQPGDRVEIVGFVGGG